MGAQVSRDTSTRAGGMVGAVLGRGCGQVRSSMQRNTDEHKIALQLVFQDMDD